jgi:hypothetical protein
MFANTVIFRNKVTGDRLLIDKDDLRYYLEDFDLTEAEVDILPITDATAQEIADKLGDEMENANYHSLTSLASDLLEELDKKDFTEEQKTQVMWALVGPLGQFS